MQLKIALTTVNEVKNITISVPILLEFGLYPSLIFNIFPFFNALILNKYVTYLII